MKKVIYDFGSNNGDDIPYYLKKSDLVVAVEANPALCDVISSRFSDAIISGRLHVENCVLNVQDTHEEVAFYVHKRDDVISQFPRPPDNQIDNFHRMLLPSRTPSEIVQKYGTPHYIKIDIEHYDSFVLECLFKNDIRPPFISAESHSIEVFSLLVALGKYESFKLLDGFSISEAYKKAKIRNVKGEIEEYSFPFHSAGPFGDDIMGEWMTADNFFRLLAYENLGWKDIHATNVIRPNPNETIRLRQFFAKTLRDKIRNTANAVFR